jgi:hypothetical protein
VLKRQSVEIPNDETFAVFEKACLGFLAAPDIECEALMKERKLETRVPKCV